MCTSLSSAYVEAFLNSVPQNAGTPVPELTKTGFFSYKSIFSRNRYSSFKCKTVEAFPLVCFFFFKHHTLQNWKQNSPDFWIKIQALQPHSKCRLLYFSLRLYHFIEYQNKQRISTPYKVLVLVRRVEGRWTLITLNFFCKSKENSISAKQIWV